jgi:hypothetical protein
MMIWWMLLHTLIKLAKVSYHYDYEEDEFEILDPIAGY